MSGRFAGLRRCAERGRGAAVIGLVLLVVAHLAGSVHAATFTGSAVVMQAPVCAHHGHGASAGGDAEARGAHHHHSDDGHADHLTDRPRAGVGDGVDALADPGSVPSLTPEQVATGFAQAGSRTGGPRLARPPDGRLTLELHCIWRQ